jgi:sensor histidine kinase regulating citrate/malate metabolism
MVLRNVKQWENMQNTDLALAIICAVLATLLAAMAVARDIGITMQELHNASARVMHAGQSGTKDFNNTVDS